MPMKTPPDTSSNTRSGFVAVIGRPNAGKSTLINALVNERIAMVSHKANATRKRQHIILMHGNTQIVLVDTPGLHERERELNKFMLKEAIRAMEECDLALFIADMADTTENYEKFLAQAGNKPHIVVLSKMDNFTHDQRLAKLIAYQPFQDRFRAIIPVSAKNTDYKSLLSEIAKNLPEGPWYFDPDDLTTQTTREVYREMIREALFDGLSDELPYEADVTIDKFEEKKKVDVITASIIIERDSQKGIVIGKEGAAIKRIGRNAREMMEKFSDRQVFLDLSVRVVPGWSKDKAFLKKLGYDPES